jgi:hypothetical protein
VIQSARVVRVATLEESLWTPFLLNFLTQEAERVGTWRSGNIVPLRRSLLTQFKGFWRWAQTRQNFEATSQAGASGGQLQASQHLSSIILPDSVYAGLPTGNFVQWTPPSPGNPSWTLSWRAAGNSTALQQEWGQWNATSASSECRQSTKCAGVGVNAYVSLGCVNSSDTNCFDHNFTNGARGVPPSTETVSFLW